MHVTMKWYGEQVYKRVYNKAAEAVIEASQECQGDIKTAIDKYGFFRDADVPGITVKYGGYEGRSRSRPGQPPFFQTGTLYRLIKYNIVRLWSAVRGDIGPDNTAVDEKGRWYAGWLEFGVESINLKPRPYMLPTFKKNLRKYTKILKTKLLEAF